MCEAVDAGLLGIMEEDVSVVQFLNRGLEILDEFFCHVETEVSAADVTLDDDVF